MQLNQLKTIFIDLFISPEETRKGPNFFPHVAAASARHTHEELQGSAHPGPCQGTAQVKFVFVFVAWYT